MKIFNKLIMKISWQLHLNTVAYHSEGIGVCSRWYSSLAELMGHVDPCADNSASVEAGRSMLGRERATPKSRHSTVSRMLALQ